MLGAEPAPPPKTTWVDPRAAEVAHVEALEKYGIPPLVPATVNAGVVVGFATLIKPPVKLTLVTVPVVVEHVVHVRFRVPPSETAPPPPRGDAALIVMEELASAAFGTASYVTTFVLVTTGTVFVEGARG